MFEIKYYFNGVELKDNMKVKLLISTSYDDVEEVSPIQIKHNKLYYIDHKKDLIEIDNCFVKIIDTIN